VREIPDGYRLEWIPDDAWKLIDDGRYCRRPGCGNVAVAALDRKHKRNRWWAYCADHLYGRKIEGGVVKRERLVKIEDVPAH
jgi:hypothetical protein